MLRRLHRDQPESFAFTPRNLKWAKRQIEKYPPGRQAAAVIPLLWRAQEQEGWVTRPMVEEIARMLDMASIRVLEVATFYFMFQLQPVGSAAHVQVCGTTSCMLCGAEGLVEVCRRRIAPNPHQLSPDGRLSWEEVECLGACANAPMVQIGKDYYEDLTAARLEEIIDAFARGEVPRPGPQKGRFASEPAGGLTSLTHAERAHAANGSVELALALSDTVRPITGDEPPLPHPEAPKKAGARAPGGVTEEADVKEPPRAPPTLPEPRDGRGDDLTLLKGVGPKIAERLNEMGVFHFDQIAAWGPGEIAWAEERLGKGRVIVTDLVEQAQALAEEEGTPYAQRKLDSD